MKFISVFVFLFGVTAFLTAQKKDFNDYIIEGEAAYNAANFPIAIIKFEAAEISATTAMQKESAEIWLDSTRNGYVTLLKKEKELAIAAARRTEANRLAFLALQKIENNQPDTAVALAFLARQLIEDDSVTIDAVDRAFGNAIYAKYARDLEGHRQPVLGAVYASDGRQVLTWSRDSMARIWYPNGTGRATYPANQGPVIHAAFSPDGSRFVAAPAIPPALYWDVNGNLLQSLEGHRDEISGVKFSPDGQKFATWSRDGTAIIWGVNGNKLAELSGHIGPVKDVLFSPDGANVLTRGADQRVILWNHSGSPLNANFSHLGYIYSASFSPDGQYILTASADGTAKLWNLQGRMIWGFFHDQGPVGAAEFAPYHGTIVTASTNGLYLSEMQNQVFHSKKIDPNWTTKVFFSPDGSKFLSISKKNAKLWDLEGNNLAVLSGHQDDIETAVFSPDGQYILTGSADKTAKLWNLQGALLMDQAHFDASVHSVVFSPDGLQMLIVSESNSPTICPLPDLKYGELKISPPQLTDWQKTRYGIGN